MEDLQDDSRISSFIDEKGLEGDKETIVKMLTDVYTKIKEVSKASEDLLGFKSLREASEGAKVLAANIDNLNRSKLQTLKIAYEEAKLRTEINKANLLQVNAEIKKDQAQSRTIKKTTTTVNTEKVDNAEIITDLKQEEQRVAELSKTYNELIAKKTQLSKSGQSGSGEYVKVIKEVEQYEQQINEAIAAIEKLKAEQATIPENTNLSIGLKKQIEVKETNLLGNVSDADDVVLRRIQELEKLKTKLAEVEKEANSIRLNGDVSGTSGEYTKLINQAETYRQSITAMTEDLGAYVRRQDEVGSTGAFKKLKTDFDELKAKINDLKSAGIAGPELEEAQAKYAELARKIDTVKKSTDEVINTQRKFSTAVKESSEKGPFDQLVEQARAAKQQYNDLLAIQAKGGKVDTSEIDKAKAQWLSLQNQIRDVQKTSVDALKGKPNPELQKQIANVEKQLQETNKEAAHLIYEMQRIGKTQLGQNSQMFKSLVDQLNAADAKAIKLLNDLKKLSPAAAERNAPNTPKTSGNAEKQFEKEIAAANVLNNTYKALEAQLQALQREAEELGARSFLGTATQDEKKRLAELTVQIDELSTGLAKIDNQIGRAGRNNMSYTRQLFSLQQVLRETPSLAYGFSTFISAISNNIPILADDIKRLSEENKRLAASGQKTQSVWKSVAASFFSWQTLLLAGISIIAIYANEIAKFIVELFRSEEANRRAYIASKEYGELQDKLAKSTENLTKAFIKLGEIRNRSNDAGIRALKNELTIIEALGVSADKLFRIKGKIADLENRNAAENKSATADAVSTQFNTIADRRIPDRQDEIKAFEFGVKEQRVNQQPTVTKTDLRGNEVLVRNNNAAAIARAKELETRFQQEIDFREKLNTLDKEALAAAKVFNDAKLRIEAEYQAGRLTLEQATNAKIINENDFLMKSRDIATRTQKTNEEIVVFRENVVDDEGARVNRERKDPSKDKEFINATKLADAARKDSEASENIFTQVEEAFTRSEAAITEIKRQENEKRKFYSDEARKLALANAQAEADIVIAKNEDILNSDTATFAQRKAAISAIAQENKKLAQAEFLNVKNDLGATPNDIKIAAQQRSVTIKNVEIETNRQLLDLQQQYLERYLQASEAALKSEKNFTIKINQEIATNIEASIETRIASQRKAFEDRKRLLDEELRTELRIAGLTDREINTFKDGGQIELEGRRLTQEELFALRVKYENDVLQLTIDSAKEQTEQLARELQKQEDLHEDYVQTLERLYAELDLNSFIDYSGQVTKLNKSFLAQELLIGGYADRRKVLDDKFARQTLQNQIDNLDKQLVNLKKNYSAEEEAAALHAANMAEIRLNIAEARLAAVPEGEQNDEQRKAAALEVKAAADAVAANKAKYEAIREFGIKIIDLEKAKAEKLTELSDQEQKVIADTVAMIQESMASLAAAFANLQQARFDARMQQIQDEMDMLDRRTEKERSAIEQSVLNEEERIKQLKELDVRRNAEQENIERKRRRLEHDKAKAERNSALFTIAVDLAQAIFKITAQATAAAAIPVIGPGLAAAAYAQIPVVIGAAALNSAAVLSKPLPKYALGTDQYGHDADGGAIVGDAYRSELVETPDGRLFVTPAKPTEVYLEKGTIVHPDAEKAMREKFPNAPQPDAMVPKPVDPTLKRDKQTVANTVIREHSENYTREIREIVSSNRFELKEVTNILPTILPPPSVNIVLPDLHADYVGGSVLKAMNAAGVVNNINVDVPIEVLNKTMKEGFDGVTRAIKNMPVPINRGSRNGDLLMKYGSNYYKHL